jgi:uncharacterized protein YndB with AHSA1/START domain
MSTQSPTTPVHTEIVVEAPIERAFEVFTRDMDSWWPADMHIIEGELAGMVFEPQVGGRIYDRNTEGHECTWARVLAYDPPDRVVFSWDISTQWQIETDPDRTSEVEVRFVAESDTRTRVELEHRGIERHGEGWEAMYGAVSSPDGWRKGLAAFAAALAA